jgi:hypothetical protein
LSTCARKLGVSSFLGTRSSTFKMSNFTW